MTLVLFAVMLLVIVGMVAFAIDMGRIVLVRTQLQVAADAAAIGAAAKLGDSYEEVFDIARTVAGHHEAGDQGVNVGEEDVEIGIWDASTRTFTPTEDRVGNAVRVSTFRDERHGGEVPLLFAPVLKAFSFRMSASAVAMASPRDIAFVVDLSGSMNDDSEPCWATDAVNQEFADEGFPTVGSELMEKVFQDFNYGAFPGALEYFGSPWGAPQTQYAYAELTKNGGPLTKSAIPSQYRIASSDNESTRKRKAYSIVIDQQLARIMPNARPAPNSGVNYAYWEKYLDYMLRGVTIRSSGAGTPPKNRGTLPPNQDPAGVTDFNNPNRATFPSASSSAVQAYQNWLGYLTYAQFMMDYGRDEQPVGGVYVPLSRHSDYCPWHQEETDGGTFEFPPREQPTHASRRAIIAAIEVIRRRNALIDDPEQRDWVSVISFDRLSTGGPEIAQSLTGDYQQAMQSCTELQAVSDTAASTGTDAGLKTAVNHIKPSREGGQGRQGTDKVVVLLTDGVPNLSNSNLADVNDYIADHPSDDYFRNGSIYYNSPLVESAKMNSEHWMVYPVGLGLGTDYDFMDRMARLGGTANDEGQSARGTGNPARYEQRLAEIFEKIITSPQVRLVQ
ncbi:MAG TPA: pilus assembly protein TadG-related protein [Thermoguttaceae bacterium]|nr:pilus assembly protein TadG-related protein [Thermoguttaceae bacterium]